MKKNIDYPLFIITVVLTFFGIYMILSSTYYSNIFDESNNPLSTFYSVLKEVGLGLFLMTLAIFFPLKLIKKISPLLMIAAIVLLVLTKVMGISHHGATRWLKIYTMSSFATSEVAKLASILFFARIFSKMNKNKEAYFDAWKKTLIFGGITCALIVIQPDLSTSFIYCFIVGVMIFVAGAKMRHIVLLVTIGFFIFLVAVFSEDYRMDRLVSLDSEISDLTGGALQVNQSLMSIAEGGLFGVGPGQAYQSKNALFQIESDFIFASIAETTGFVGSVLLMIAYMIFVWRCVVIALRADTMFSSLIATGVGAMVGSQAVLHLFVTTKLGPPTGMTLPFISSGGTSVLISLISVGIVLNISTNTKNIT